MLRRTMVKGFAGLIIGAPFIAACASGGKSSGLPKASDPTRNDVLAVLPKALGFKTLNELVKHAGILDQLMAPGHYTLFAPTDVAFGALGQGRLVRLRQPEHRDELVRLLRHHLLNEEILGSNIRKGQSLQTMAGTRLKVDVHGRQVSVGGANLVKNDIRASNGVVHVIDAVLIPPRA